MLAKIEPLDFLLLADAKADRKVDNLQDDERPNDRQSPCTGGRHNLAQKCAAPFDQSQWLAMIQILDCSRGKNSGQNRS